MDQHTTVGDVGEQFLLDRFSARPPSTRLIVGPGDDCAVAQGTSVGQLLLLKTDCVIAGVHFSHHEDLERVGNKALARAISDIAAMGGTPLEALITLVLPPSLTVAKLDALYRGLDAMAAKFNVNIAGGETSSAPPPHHDAFFINVALTGSVADGKFITRSGGSPGDQLFVTGQLGGSIHGHHLDFIPRVSEGQWLAAQGASAMMDLSDGLAKDLPRLAAMSDCSSRIVLDSLPLSQNRTIENALNDGEDYELLVALPPEVAASIDTHWQKHFPSVPFTKIGELLTIDSPAATPLTGGYDHFHHPHKN